MLDWSVPLSDSQHAMRLTVQLVVSSSVSMLVPLTVGRLIDYFSSNQVSLDGHSSHYNTLTLVQDALFGMSFPVAASVLAGAFVIGAACNTGLYYLHPECTSADGFNRTGYHHEIVRPANYRPYKVQ